MPCSAAVSQHLSGSRCFISSQNITVFTYPALKPLVHSFLVGLSVHCTTTSPWRFAVVNADYRSRTLTSFDPGSGVGACVAGCGSVVSTGGCGDSGGLCEPAEGDNGGTDVGA